ncbi:MAG: hypothetical protein AAGG72_08875 [Pseudomonadota bacterium]
MLSRLRNLFALGLIAIALPATFLFQQLYWDSTVNERVLSPGCDFAEAFIRFQEFQGWTAIEIARPTRWQTRPFLSQFEHSALDRIRLGDISSFHLSECGFYYGDIVETSSAISTQNFRDELGSRALPRWERDRVLITMGQVVGEPNGTSLLVSYMVRTESVYRYSAKTRLYLVRVTPHEGVWLFEPLEHLKVSDF